MKKVLFIGFVWPEPLATAAGTRIMQLIDFFKEARYKLHFASAATKTTLAAHLEEKGVQMHSIKMNDASFDLFLKTLHPELVVFDRFMTEEQFGWRVEEILPESLKIVDTEDLHFLRKAREQNFKKNTTLKKDYRDSDIAKREIASIYRCDLSLIISEKEMEILKNHFGIPNYLLFYLPFMFENISEEKIKQLPDFKHRKNFVSIGNFRHAPNWNACLLLKEKIWPQLLHLLPEAQLHIYGAYVDKKATNLHAPKEGFHIKGWTADAQKELGNARICLAPLQFGAGLKGKLMQAMQTGTPSITTPVGAEGINSSLPWNGKITTDISGFITAAFQYYTDEKLWNNAQEMGFQILKKRFSKEFWHIEFAEGLENLFKNYKQARKNNFIGAMLKHHQHRSTYFMSKYIEAKNKFNN